MSDDRHAAPYRRAPPSRGHAAPADGPADQRFGGRRCWCSRSCSASRLAIAPRCQQHRSSGVRRPQNNLFGCPPVHRDAARHRRRRSPLVLRLPSTGSRSRWPATLVSALRRDLRSLAAFLCWARRPGQTVPRWPTSSRARSSFADPADPRRARRRALRALRCHQHRDRGPVPGRRVHRGAGLRVRRTAPTAALIGGIAGRCGDGRAARRCSRSSTWSTRSSSVSC